ncbi:MAG: hypothetical protein UT19_C0011G0022 [Candidatus Woesebacteria bacterium GW2011_GWB1_39_10b]|uniref:Peptidase M50 domain-containing protein n=3 Tax=Candidatus Woeseibacteriota TaxID=1752722 RepID=A0A0G0NBY4_9BACT|nr:MAG: hypothetical protein US72_C0012G0022 [Microgenomates group bacterium GW2011_GWC1_38_12]KKQ93477.1 MAG: hypothetical protein UT19_C0011G0022 [Candidatus Woesebacteria bacterium GW2011_GWB1_39_10b]KKR13639.1 MAG: hypothetical protein UT40_C0012G0005 [Candidatus Woesebacteria bacterium GW2011_GWA1_39_21b]
MQPCSYFAFTSLSIILIKRSIIKDHMEIIGWIIAFVVAITIHEASHAWMSDRLGDPTARLMGRLSLNPIVHYDPIGTTLLLFLVIMRALGFPVIPFGWAKPVQFDPYNLKNPRRDSALISLAGPASNLTFAIILSLLLRFVLPTVFVASLFYPLITLNVVLAVFNLIPVHPLDGGKIFVGFLPEKDAYEADLFLKRYGILILFFLIFPTLGGRSPLMLLISPVFDFILRILLPGANLI